MRPAASRASEAGHLEERRRGIPPSAALGTSQTARSVGYLLEIRTSVAVNSASDIDDDDPPVLGRIGISGISWIGRPLSHYLQPCRGHSDLFYQIVFDGLRPPAGQDGIDLNATGGVRMSFDQEGLLIGELVVESVPQVAQGLRRFGRKLSRRELELYSIKGDRGTRLSAC